MRTYELVLILPPAFSEEEQNQVLNKIIKLAENEKGKISLKTSWGKKTFSYSFKKNTEGIYWLLDLEINPDAAVSLAKQLKLNEQVLRFLLIRKESSN